MSLELLNLAQVYMSTEFPVVPESIFEFELCCSYYFRIFGYCTILSEILKWFNCVHKNFSAAVVDAKELSCV